MMVQGEGRSTRHTYKSLEEHTDGAAWDMEEDFIEMTFDLGSEG